MPQTREFKVVITSVMAPPTDEAVQRILSNATGDLVLVEEVE